MYLVGIDISKFKHDCFIATETNKVIKPTFSFENNSKGFSDLLNVLKTLDKSQEIRIGLEATGHYGSNLKMFLYNHGYQFMEFNPLLSERHRQMFSLRKTKTDKIDARIISKMLLSLDYKTYSLKSYHITSLKSLTRYRLRLIEARTKYKVRLQNILDHIFPEYSQFFSDLFGATSLYILNNYPAPETLVRANVDDLYDKIYQLSRGKYHYSKFLKLIDSAKNTIGHCDQFYELQLQSIIKMINVHNEEINKIETEIETVMKKYSFPTSSIPGIGLISTASIISEFGDISYFENPAKMLSFAGLEPSIYQSGTQTFSGRMVKRGSSELRYILMNVSMFVIKYNKTFYDYYHKKRNEGKYHRVALSHVAKKLLRVIFHLEKTNQKFNENLLR